MSLNKEITNYIVTFSEGILNLTYHIQCELKVHRLDYYKFSFKYREGYSSSNVNSHFPSQPCSTD